MGWSCSKAANDTLDRLTEYYKGKGEKSSNVFTNGDGQKYFWDVNTSREYRDGRITGQVFKFVGPGENTVIKIGSFCIEPDGKIIRFPRLESKVKSYLNLCVTESFVVIP